VKVPNKYGFKMIDTRSLPKGWKVMRLEIVAEIITNYKYKKPQINADERRYIPVTYFIKITHRKERKVAQQEPLRFCVNKIRYDINNELGRTDTNSGHSEFVRVRISSLLISVLRLLCATAHGRTPPMPAPAVHPRSSRAWG